MASSSSTSSALVAVPIDHALPAELIMDILALLSVKDLVHCMLVSKRFLDLVSGVMRCRTGSILARRQDNSSYVTVRALCYLISPTTGNVV